MKRVEAKCQIIWGMICERFGQKKRRKKSSVSTAYCVVSVIPTDPNNFVANLSKLFAHSVAALDEGDIELLKTYVSDCHLYALFLNRV